MAIEGPQAGHNQPASLPKSAESPKKETVKIEGMSVATSLEGTIPSPRPRASSEGQIPLMSDSTRMGMLKGVSENRDLGALRSITSQEISGEAKMNILAREETDKDRAADIRANKEELQDQADTTRVDKEETKPSL